MEKEISKRIQKYITEGTYFSFTKESINAFQRLEYSEHVEPRIRKDDLTEALSLKVYDPLWMLSRQWLMGEFRGNNAGTAVSVRCQVRQEDCSKDPIEPVTEQVNPNIDLMVRVESAMHYLDLLADNTRKPVPSATIEQLRKDYPIAWEGSDKHILDCEATKEAEDNLNSQRVKFANTFRKKAFDGYQLYLAKKNENTTLAKDYAKWFREQYLPAGEQGDTNSHWQERALNYTVNVNAGPRNFRGDRYQGGRLSWYTVDDDGGTGRTPTPQTTVLSLPTPAQYAGAPNKRLWQFEDRRVFMGNSAEQQSKANEIFLKFATLYSNDWMLIPLKTAIGKYITVESIEVRDTFGVVHVIDKGCRAGAKDKLDDSSQEKWQVFTNSKYGKIDGSAENGLFYAPQLAATMEGKPFEEVELLRDEMANMVWGVEKLVSDGCGFTLDEQLKAVQLNTFVGDLYEKYRKKAEPGTVTFSEDGSTERKNVPQSDYRYTLQTHVPFNWIPFVPQRIQDKETKDYFHLGGREMVLRRGKMPCHILTGNGYVRKPVLPVTSIMRKGLDLGVAYQPMLVNEEEIQQTGIKLTKNYQRARWLNGKIYLWAGMYKKLAKFSEKSGLEFDTLHKK